MATPVKATRALAVSAVLSALGVVLLALGSLIEVLSLTVAVIASICVIFTVIELGGKYPYLVFAVTATLGMLLAPGKSAPLAYLCFLGWYPILKAILERHLPPLWCWVVKILVFNAGLAVLLVITLKVLTLYTVPHLWYYAFLPLFTPVFVLYDVALTRLISLYLRKWHDRFSFLHK